MVRLNRLALTSLALALVCGGLVTAPASAEPQAACSAFSTNAYQVVNPRTQASLVTTSSKEVTSSKRYGFTDERGVQFSAAGRDGTGLDPVYRLYQPRGGDFMWTSDTAEITVATTTGGYVAQGVNFFASATPSPCLVAAHTYVKGGKHRLAVASQDRSALGDAGWTDEGPAFYVAPVPTTAPEPAPPSTDGDSTFSIAVMPDTQQEVLRSSDSRMKDRSQWLADERDELDLRFVTHTGDVVNWDTPDHSQYKIASAGLAPLETAGIPYSLTVGNHDTAAVCAGGSACDPKRTRALVRDTTTFNDYFNADRYGNVAGQFETGKVDNAYSTFTAGGVKWMVLNLELWPRATAVAWAKRVVSAHPDYNVIVTTHSYLTASGSIATSAGYGDTSPQELYDDLISQYANIKFVFSGHTGQSASRVDVGAKGNTVHSFLQAFHDSSSNPVRLVTIDTAKGTLKTWIYAPSSNREYPLYDIDLAGLTWVR